MDKGYTVTMVHDYGCGETYKPLAIGVDRATAKSIKKHFEKECTWSDYSQTGTYIIMISRKYCVNHKDFEINTMEEV